MQRQLLTPNVLAHRPRASGIRLQTAALSRGSVDPFGNQNVHVSNPAAAGPANSLGHAATAGVVTTLKTLNRGLRGLHG